MRQYLHDSLCLCVRWVKERSFLFPRYSLPPNQLSIQPENLHSFIWKRWVTWWHTAHGPFLLWPSCSRFQQGQAPCLKQRLPKLRCWLGTDKRRRCWLLTISGFTAHLLCACRGEAYLPRGASPYLPLSLRESQGESHCTEEEAKVWRAVSKTIHLLKQWKQESKSRFAVL